MSEDWGFAPPPFKPEDALAGLKRNLRELGLTEREGRFERRGVAIARVAVDTAGGGAIKAERVKRPSRSSPEWLTKTLDSSAQVRDFVADLKQQLARWSDFDD